MENTTEIIARQKEEIREKLKGEIVERDVQKKLKNWLNKSLVKVITGVRRSGKSVLALLLLKGENFGYANFDERGLVKASLDSILSAVKEVYGDVKILLFDEIQNVEGWELWVNSLQRRGYNLIITGSNARLLSKELATHLTGRYIEIENYPFSFKEFLRWKKIDLSNASYLAEKQGIIKKALKEYMSKGGFPQYLVEKLDRDYLRTLFNSIIYADIVARWKIRNPLQIENIARYLLSIYAREYSATKLRKILKMKSSFTVQEYIKHVEEAFLIFSLERFSFKAKEFMKAPKKAYSIDLGLSNAVGSIVIEEIGLKMENLVFLELKRNGLKEGKDIFYLRLTDGEVDFVVKGGLRVKQLIQVTYASSKDEIERREIKSLIKAGEIFKRDKPELLVITWDYEGIEEIKGKKIKFIPLWKWLLSRKV